MNKYETRVFADREQAAKELSIELQDLKDKRPLVLGVPRGAVPMAKIIAEELGGDLDIILVHKVGHPTHAEFGVASVTEEGEIIMGEGGRQVGITMEEIQLQAMREIDELQRKRAMFTPHRGPIDPAGRVVVVVDDGIATGATMEAAIRSLQMKNAGRIIVATPVASSQAVERLKEQGIEVRVLSIPPNFYAVGQFFEDFTQVSDEEVCEILGTDSPEITIRSGRIRLNALLTIPTSPKGTVIFAHGSGSGRHSPRNQFVARTLNDGGFATLLADLLTEDESYDRTNVFDISLLASRLALLCDWVGQNRRLMQLPVGLFGASTGAAAALDAAAQLKDHVQAVVSRGGRPDLSKQLSQVEAPTLLIVGGADGPVIGMNRWAFDHLTCEKDLQIVPGASHLFEEPGTLEEVAELANAWFERYLTTPAPHLRREETRAPRRPRT